MSVRSRLKSLSVKACKAFYEFDSRTNGWLSPLLSIPLILSFKAATSLETPSERENRLADTRENELMHAIRKMVYNPAYLLGTEETRQNQLRGFSGDEDSYTVREMMDCIESDFPKVWGSLLVYGNREQNLDFIAHHAIRKVDDRTNGKSLRDALAKLMNNPDTFGYEINPANQISIEDAYSHIEKINSEREAKIRELAELAVFNHGLGVSMTGYDKVRAEMNVREQREWLKRYDITADDVLNYAIDHAGSIIDTRYGDMEEKTKNSLRKGMAILREQRDGVPEIAADIHHSL